MAVTTLPRARTAARHVAPTLPPALVLLMLLAPVLDLLGWVQPRIDLEPLALAAAVIGFGTILLAWLRHPRTTWLLAATLAGAASVALRAVGAEVAPALSLLVVLALGVGGVFASPSHELEETWLESQPGVAHR